jgi:hypothetical protein
MHLYEVRPRKDHRGVDLISHVLPFGSLWYGEPNAVTNAIGYAMHRSRSYHAMIRVYNSAGNGIETHEHAYSSRTHSCSTVKLAVKDEVTSSAWAGEMKLQKNERPPMRRPLRILLNAGLA